MATIYFNSEILGHRVPIAESIRGFCFRPLHYFLEGKTRTWTGVGFRESKETYPADQKNWPASLKMAVLVLPGLAVGTAAAAAALARWCLSLDFPNLCSALFKESQDSFYSKEDKTNLFTAPMYELTTEFSPNQSHAALHAKWSALISCVTSPDRWKDAAVRTEFGQILEEAYKEMNLVFQHAAKAAGNDPAKMAKLMSAQYIYTNRGPENYCRAFFYGSIGGMYYAVRTSLWFEKNENDFRWVFDGREIDRSLSSKNTKPFFTPGTPEYRWRRLYNDACGFIDRYPGLREALQTEDDRFLKCAIPDFSPSIAPSSWTDVPTC